MSSIHTLRMSLAMLKGMCEASRELRRYNVPEGYITALIEQAGRCHAEAVELSEASLSTDGTGS